MVDNGNQVYWLDNDRVLFNGADHNELVPRPTDGRLVPKSGLFIWDTKTNRVTRYGDIDGRLCYAEGYVRYPVRSVGELVAFRVGKFGAEEERQVVLTPGEPRPAINELTCREFHREDFSPNPQQNGVPLREGHGFLHLGPWDKGKIIQDHREDEPIYLHPEGGKPAVALPMDKREASHLVLSYSAFSDAYLLYSWISKSGRIGIIAPWPRGKAQPLYLVRPDGYTRVIEVPYHESRSGGGIRYWLVRPGVFMMSHNLGIDGPGYAGGYLIQGQRFTRLFRGYIVAVGISPDGCKVAVGIKPRDERDKERWAIPELKMVNVCVGEVRDGR